MEQRQAYQIYLGQGWSAVDAAWAAVHGPEPADPDPEPAAEPEAG